MRSMRFIMNYRKISVTILATIIYSVAAAVCANDVYIPSKFDTLKVYFIGWDVATAMRLDPSDVRRERVTYIETTDSVIISNVVKELGMMKCETLVHRVKDMDMRIVFDFYSKNRLSQSYVGARGI